MGDDRGNLALEYLRLADRLRPRWLVWENVPGVLSSNGGRDFGAILGGMVELGYGIAYRVLDAQHFGVPQRRRRVFVVGYSGDWRRAAAVLFERESLRGDSPPRREARKDVAPTISTRPTGGGGLGTDFDLDGGLIARCLNAHPNRSDGESETFIAHSMRADGFDAGKDGTGRGTPIVPVAFAIQERAVSENADAGPDGMGVRTDGMAYTLEARQTVQAVAVQECVTGVREYDTAGSLRANGPGHDPVGTRVRLGSAVRRLTPTECERLQGFPDGWTNVPYRGKAAADGPRYKALGNSMAVPCMAWIGRRIAAVEALT